MESPVLLSLIGAGGSQAGLASSRPSDFEFSVAGFSKEDPYRFGTNTSREEHHEPT
jgi:hypothetical protein